MEYILGSKIKTAIVSMKSEKRPRIDHITAELVQAGEDCTVKTIHDKIV